MKLEAWSLQREAWRLQLLSSASCSNSDGAIRVPLVLGVYNIFNGFVPALPAALALATLVRCWACFTLSISHSRRPGPALAGCAVDLGC